jgi:hypothetical protein
MMRAIGFVSGVGLTLAVFLLALEAVQNMEPETVAAGSEKDRAATAFTPSPIAAADGRLGAGRDMPRSEGGAAARDVGKTAGREDDEPDAGSLQERMLDNGSVPERDGAEGAILDDSGTEGIPRDAQAPGVQELDGQAALGSGEPAKLSGGGNATHYAVPDGAAQSGSAAVEPEPDPPLDSTAEAGRGAASESLTEVLAAVAEQVDSPAAAIDPERASAAPVETRPAESDRAGGFEAPGSEPGAQRAAQANASFGAPRAQSGADRYLFWSPFRSAWSARGFARSLTAATQVPVEVIDTGPGKYRVGFRYRDETERLARISRIETITGLQLE